MKRWNSLLALPLAACALIGSEVHAAETTQGNVGANVLATILVDETTAMDFGDITDTTNAVCTMIADGTLTGSGCTAASGTAGLINIQATQGRVLDVTMTVDTAVDGGVTFAPTWFNGGASVAGGTTASITASDPTAGGDDLTVAGELRVNSTATEGLRTWTYTVSVAYQ